MGVPYGPLGSPWGSLEGTLSTRCAIFRVSEGSLGAPLYKPYSVQFSSVVQNTAGAESGAKTKLSAGKSPSGSILAEPRPQLPGSR